MPSFMIVLPWLARLEWLAIVGKQVRIAPRPHAGKTTVLASAALDFELKKTQELALRPR
jgi:hypothetical protein